MAKLQEQVDRHERQIAAIRNLIHQGMRLRVETRRDIRALAVAQKHTEENLQAFDSELAARRQWSRPPQSRPELIRRPWLLPR